MESWFAIKRSISSKVPVLHLHTMELTEQLKFFLGPEPVFSILEGRNFCKNIPQVFFFHSWGRDRQYKNT